MHKSSLKSHFPRGEIKGRNSIAKEAILGSKGVGRMGSLTKKLPKKPPRAT